MPSDVSDQTRYRIAGAVFLVAVAIIVLPMLFDGAGIQSSDVRPTEPPVIEGLDVADNPKPDFTQAVEARDRIAAMVDDEGYLAESGTLIGEPVLTSDRVEARQWAVQVASFSQPENALALRDALLADDFPAWLSHAKTGNRRSTRVAVGPMMSRDDAEAMRQRLAPEYGDAIVVSFSP